MIFDAYFPCRDYFLQNHPHPRMLFDELPSCQDIGQKMNAVVHIIIRGLVQGVGFRYFVHRKASALGVKGWVRNLYSGDVEIEAEGNKLILEHFIAEIRTGPRAAWVKELLIDWREEQGKYTGFEIR